MNHFCSQQFLSARAITSATNTWTIGRPKVMKPVSDLRVGGYGFPEFSGAFILDSISTALRNSWYTGSLCTYSERSRPAGRYLSCGSGLLGCIGEGAPF